MDYPLIRNFFIALLIGALVGMEREKVKVEEGRESRGLRSFILIAEAGAISAWLSMKLAIPWIFMATLLSVMILVLSGYVLPTRETQRNYGLTTEIASLVVFLLGGMTLFGYPELAVALGITASLILAYKKPLHGLVEKIGPDDLSAILKLLVATFIVLPFLPDRPVDPLGALNPYSLWFLVILISALSLVGYVAVRWLGPKRGTAITGLAGGLVSSTAVTLSFAKRSREETSHSAGSALATGILLAWGIMFVRVVIEVAIVYFPLVRSVLIPFSAMAVTTTAVAVLIYRRMGHDSPRSSSTEEVSLKNPFSLTSALSFALFFALVLVLVKLAERYFPGQGIYGVAALAGLTDVDAITLSMAQSVRQGGPAGTAVTAITLASLTNTLVKTGIVLMLAQGVLRKRILLGSLAIFAAGMSALLIFKG